jgi:hypothetical protein
MKNVVKTIGNENHCVTSNKSASERRNFEQLKLHNDISFIGIV